MAEATVVSKPAAPAAAAPAATPAPAAKAPAKPTGPAKGDVWGTGRRKSSVARVRVKKGAGKFLVNRKAVNDYFPLLQDRMKVEEALARTSAGKTIDIHVSVAGGGPTGQAGAIAMGLARALRKYDSAYEETLRTSGLLTRDSRMKERKKYGRRGARRGFQFSKR